jgi:hypothetical protein
MKETLKSAVTEIHHNVNLHEVFDMSKPILLTTSAVITSEFYEVFGHFALFLSVIYTSYRFWSLITDRREARIEKERIKEQNRTN